MFPGLSLPYTAVVIYRPNQARPVASFAPDADLDAIKAELHDRRLFGEFVGRPRTARGVEDQFRTSFFVEPPQDTDDDDDDDDALDRQYESQAAARYARAADKEIEASELRAQAQYARQIAEAQAEAAQLRVRVQTLESERHEWRSQAEGSVERVLARVTREREQEADDAKRAHDATVRRLERQLEDARLDAEAAIKQVRHRATMEQEYQAREISELREKARALDAALEAERAERYAERLRLQESEARARADLARARQQSESQQQLDVVRGMAGLLKEADPEVRPMLTQSFSAQLGVAPPPDPSMLERLIAEVAKNPEMIEPVISWAKERFLPGTTSPQPQSLAERKRI